MTFAADKNRHGANLVVFGRLRVRCLEGGKESARRAAATAEKLNKSEEALQLAHLIEPTLDKELRLWRLAAIPERSAARLWEIAEKVSS